MKTPIVYNNIQEFKKNDFQHFDLFYESIKKDVFYNILSIVHNYEDAEEILQETFVTFLKNLSKIDEHHSPMGYLFKISYNLSKDFYRKKSKEIAFEDNQEENIKSEFQYDESLDIIQKIREILNKKEFQIYIMKVLHDYSHQEIAIILNKPIGTITWCYQQAIKKLKKGMGELYE